MASRKRSFASRVLVLAGEDESPDLEHPGPQPAVTEQAVPEQALVDLLGGPLGIGAVVPLLLDGHGRVAEAGTFAGPSGAVTSFDTGAAPAAPEHSFRRDVAGTSSAVVAVSSEALEGFATGSRGPDAKALVRDVLEYVRGKGLRVVYEPSWRVPAPEGFSPLPAPGGPRQWAQRDHATPTRVLVVTGTVPGTLVSPEGLVEIVEALAQSRCSGHAGLRRWVRGQSFRRLLPAPGGRGRGGAGRLAVVVRRPPVPLLARPAERRRPHDAVVVAGARHPASSPLHPLQRTAPLPAQPGHGSGVLACTGH